MPEFYVIFARKMPEFYMIIVLENIFPDFLGGGEVGAYNSME